MRVRSSRKTTTSSSTGCYLTSEIRGAPDERADQGERPIEDKRDKRGPRLGTACVPIVVRDSVLIVEALEKLRRSMPLPLRGFDTDNGSEFLNEAVIDFCKTRGKQTRSRPYRKNDQAWVEQKNGAAVRRLVGYRRFEGISAAAGLARLYGASRFFVNFFQPSSKLAQKRREGARVSRVYHPPATPFARLLESSSVPSATKQRLHAVAESLDPLQLLEEIRATQHYLAGLAQGQTPHCPERSDGDLQRFLGSLATARRDGEIRPTHRATPRPQRDWRTRVDPFAEVEIPLRAWFDREPDVTAKELRGRLRRDHEGTFTAAQLRTLQRRVKAWRATAARDLLLGEDLSGASLGKIPDEYAVTHANGAPR